MATVIDSLLVTLGIDDAPYKKGAANVNRANKGLRDQTKKDARDIAASITSVARTVGLLVLGFESLRGAARFMADINNGDAAMGRLARNTGVSVQELNEWALAVELAGGAVDEAKADVASLASSITDLKATGTVSPLLLLMQRLGVAIFDAEGRSRDLFDILNDAGGKLRQFNRADAFQLGKGAGISEGTLNLLLLEEAARRRIFEQARANNNLDDDAAKRAQALQTQWRDIGQNMREFGRELLEAITPFAVAFMNAVKPVQDVVIDIVRKLNDLKVPEALANGLLAIAKTLNAALDRWDKVSEQRAEAAAHPEQQPARLRDPFGPTPAQGETQGEYDARVERDRIRRQNIVNERERFGVAAAARLYAEQQRITAGGSNTTTVQIDQVTVNTAATDAEGIAADLPAALRRKGVVAQADTGMN